MIYLKNLQQFERLAGWWRSLEHQDQCFGDSRNQEFLKLSSNNKKKNKNKKQTDLTFFFLKSFICNSWLEFDCNRFFFMIRTFILIRISWNRKELTVQKFVYEDKVVLHIFFIQLPEIRLHRISKSKYVLIKICYKTLILSVSHLITCLRIQKPLQRWHFAVWLRKSKHCLFLYGKRMFLPYL